MNENMYDNYYWQNDKVRLRLWLPKDAEYNYLVDLDSDGMSLVQEEVTLPPVKPIIDENSESAKPNIAAPAFSIETLDGEYVGHIHFNYINERHGTFSIGMINIRNQRGKGYGEAAIRLLLDYAFNERRLHKFNAYCLGVNIASAGLMKKLGCKQEGIVREVVFMNGKYHNQLLFGMTEDEYRVQK